MAKYNKKAKKAKVAGIPNKLQKHLNTAWTDDFDAMSEADLKVEIIKSENAIVEQEGLEEQDEPLKEAKLIVKDLRGGYREAMDYQKTKIKYALIRLEQLGQL